MDFWVSRKYESNAPKTPGKILENIGIDKDSKPHRNIKLLKNKDFL